MSKKEQEQQKPPLIFYGIILAFIVIVGLNFAGDYNLREQITDDPQIQANMDNIDFLIETDITIQEAIVGQTIRTVENKDAIAELTDYDKVITTQIGNINADIRNKFPQSQGLPSEGQTSSTPTTPFLTLSMDETEFNLGNVVIFTGTAHPNDPIFITLKLPDRGLESIAVSKSKIIDGSWTGNFTLRLDDPIGTWQVYARQVSEQTRTLTFTVE